MTPDEMKRRREALTLTQAQLASAAGVCRESVLRFEAGKRQHKAIAQAIIRALLEAELRAL